MPLFGVDQCRAILCEKTDSLKALGAICHNVWILRNPAETKYGTLES